MASIILSSIGSSVGNMMLPGLGGKLMSSLARKVGHVVDGEIGWSTSSVAKDGPRLESFKVQDSRYGVSIPQAFGRIRVAGNVIWASDLIETSHEETVSGGKGGVMSDAFSSSRTTYTYSLNCAIALAQGEIGGIQTIWADSKVIYQNGVWTCGVLASAHIHNGAADQDVDPLLEGWIGAGMTPAYRGVAYIVLEGLQLKGFGNRLPNMTFELLPKVETGAPTWLGNVNPEIYQPSYTVTHRGMPPLIIDGGAVSARRMLVGGYNTDGFNTNFTVIEYDVTDDTPLEIRRDQSTSFVASYVGDTSWALAPDKRTVALGLQDAGDGNTYNVALYDSTSNMFGPVLSVPMTVSQYRQIAWIDALHFVVPDKVDGAAGVRVFLRAGLSLIDLGFRNVWGTGTATTRVPVGYTCFMKYGDGLLMMMGNKSLKFGTLYACYLAWSDNELSFGAPYVVSSGYDQGTGNGPQVTIQKTSDEEWTLFYMTVVDMQMMSFVPTKTGLSVTRPWQKLVSTPFAIVDSQVPVVSGGRIVVIHNPYLESKFRISEIALGDGCFTLVQDGVQIPDVMPPTNYMTAVTIDPQRVMVMGNVGYDGTLGFIGVIRRRNTGDTLDNVVSALLRRAGYDAADIEVEALADTQVDGYVLSEQATAASAIAPLQLLKPFDLIEHDGKLVAVTQDSGVSVSVPVSEGGATAHLTEEPAPTLTQARAQELDLPVEVTVDYLDVTRDYEVGSQRARRTATKGARSKAKIELPVVCSASEAKRIAESQLYAAWVERDRYRLVLSRAWVGLDPADVVTFGDVRLRITSVTYKDGLVQVDGVRAVPQGFGSNAMADAAQGYGAAYQSEPTATTLALMDLPLLRNEDDSAGVYVAASGLEGWNGASLWACADGVNFAYQTGLTAPAAMGVALTVLPECVPHYMDRASAVRVQMLRGGLSSCTEAELMNGANVAVLGGEIVQFQTATLIETGVYELRNLLRARRGTESSTACHVVGERFVMLTATSTTFLGATLSDRGKLTHLRAVTNGGSLDYAQDMPFTYSLRTLEPFAPAQLRGVRASGAGSDLTIGWVRRARKNAAWVDYIDVPLDEDSELYDVEIMNGASVVRTFGSVALCSVVYSAAQQMADWGASVPAQIAVKVYQRSARYGRGRAEVGVV